MTRRLELLLRPAATEGGPLRLCAPTVGVFTEAIARGRAVVPGAPAGALRSLGRAIELVVPPGATGRVVSEPPRRVHLPVGYGDVLYEIAPLAGEAEEDSGAPARAADAAGPALRAPCAGRFWSRPAPGEPAFVAAGDVVEAGAVVGLIEVMKTFTQIHYAAGPGLPPRARVVRVAPSEGGEVREGDVLVELEEA